MRPLGPCAATFPRSLLTFRWKSPALVRCLTSTPPFSAKKLRCHICGEQGHIAPVCPKRAQYCPKCRQPGHTLSSCPNPIKCHNCGGEGHISTSCPSPRKNPCFICGELGHLPSSCPQLKCFTCGKTGHSGQSCLNARPTPEPVSPKICHNCRQPGHFHYECPKPTQCHTCGGEGHITASCPERKSRFARKKSASNSHTAPADPSPVSLSSLRERISLASAESEPEPELEPSDATDRLPSATQSIVDSDDADSGHYADLDDYVPIPERWRLQMLQLQSSYASDLITTTHSDSASDSDSEFEPHETVTNDAAFASDELTESDLNPDSDDEIILDSGDDATSSDSDKDDATSPDSDKSASDSDDDSNGAARSDYRKAPTDSEESASDDNMRRLIALHDEGLSLSEFAQLCKEYPEPDDRATWGPSTRKELDKQWKAILAAHQEAVDIWEMECEAMREGGMRVKDLPKKPKRPLKPKLVNVADEEEE